MTPEEARRLLEAATRIDPAVGLALRLAAVTGAQRGEIAALQWDDLDGCCLTIDSCIIVQRDRDNDADPILIDASIKPVSDRSMCLDLITVKMAEQLRSRRGGAGPYMLSTELDPPSPDRIGEWWHQARELSGVRGTQHLDELHEAFGATVVNVLQFGEPEMELAPDPIMATEPVPVPVTIAVAAERPVRARLWRFWLSMLDLSEPAAAHAAGSDGGAAYDAVPQRRPRKSVPAALEVTVALMLTVFVLVHLF